MGNQIKYKRRWNTNEAVNRIIYYFLFVQYLKINYTVQKLLFLSIVGKDMVLFTDLIYIL